jgi:hypothetical protein
MRRSIGLTLYLVAFVACTSTTSPTRDGATDKQDQLTVTDLDADLSATTDAGPVADATPPDVDGTIEPDNALQIDVAPGPDLAQPDAARPDLAQPDAAQPDMAQPDMAQPDLALPDMPGPDMPSPDIIKPDTIPQPTWSKPTRLDAMTDDEKELQLAVDAKGNVYVAWVSINSISTEVEVVRRDVSTGAWSKPVRLDTMTDDEKELRLAAGPAGVVHAAWIELGFISTEIEVVSYLWP